MMDPITFQVRGIPKAQPRPRAVGFKDKSGNFRARVHDAGTAEAWKGDVLRAGQPFRPGAPLEGPLWVSIAFYLPRPKRLMRKKDPDGPVWATCKPDRDNLEKAVLDALTADGWWRDDSQVVCGDVRKFYHPKGGSPGASIAIAVVSRSPSV